MSAVLTGARRNASPLLWQGLSVAVVVGAAVYVLSQIHVGGHSGTNETTSHPTDVPYTEAECTAFHRQYEFNKGVLEGWQYMLDHAKTPEDAAYAAAEVAKLQAAQADLLAKLAECKAQSTTN